jgi:hypothetical protein
MSRPSTHPSGTDACPPSARRFFSCRLALYWYGLLGFLRRSAGVLVVHGAPAIAVYAYGALISAGALLNAFWFTKILRSLFKMRKGGGKGGGGGKKKAAVTGGVSSSANKNASNGTRAPTPPKDKQV